ncbi:MAG: type II secretion system F family protein [Candidatus Roizmanbacteria bacterium]
MNFTYKALQNGKAVNGKAEADSADKLAKLLKDKGMTVLDVQEQKKSLSESFSTSFSKITFNDVVDFTRQVAMMLNAGLTIVDSLEILKKQTAKPATLALIHQIDNDVRAGNSFSDALKQHKGLFSNLYISLVKAGEASGKLDEILLKLADNLDKQREFRGKIKGALVYPAIIVVAMFVVMFIMITFVIPKLLNLYKDFNVQLPITTRIIIGISDFFQKTWILLIFGTIGFVYLARKYIQTASGKELLDRFMLKLPLIGKIIAISALVDATRTLAILIGAGVSILESLDIVIGTTDNIVYQKAFQRIYTDVEKGKSFGQSLEEQGIFPPIFVQMSGVGEQTGNLDDTLIRISHYFELESEMAVKAMTTLIEPMILLVLGFFVGFLVLSVITPIYNLTSSFK